MKQRWALLVVDVQRDFCPGGALPASGCDRIIPVINRYLADARERGMPIYASRDWHPEVTDHFAPYGGQWPPHCVQESPGAEFDPALQLPPDAIVVNKGAEPTRPGYSAFDGHTLDGRSFADSLRECGIDALSIAGIATEYCVKLTALDARRAGLRVNVLTDAIAGIEQQPGDVRRALAELSDAGAHLGTELRPVDVVLLAVDWQSRAPLRAQLIEEGYEVVATDAWPAARRALRPGIKQQLLFVDLKDLPDADRVLDDLEILMKTDRVLVLTSLGTIPASELERRGFHVIRRPVAVDDIVSAIANLRST